MEFKDNELNPVDIAAAAAAWEDEDEDGWTMERPDDSLLELAPDQERSVAYAEGYAAGKNTMLKEIIKRKLLKGQTSAQIAEDLDEDIKDVEMLIVQILERC